MIRRTLRPAALTLAALPVLAGCYSREHLLEHARNRAIHARVDEIDLGSYRVTLPRNPLTGDFTEIDVHLYGEAPRYQHNEIEDLLEERKPMIEDLAYRTLRETPGKLLIEPELHTLRAQLRDAFNEHLGETPLKAIGFYDIRFMRH